MNPKRYDVSAVYKGTREGAVFAQREGNLWEVNPGGNN